MGVAYPENSRAFQNDRSPRQLFHFAIPSRGRIKMPPESSTLSRLAIPLKLTIGPVNASAPC